MTSGNFTFTEASISGIYIVEQKRFGDYRGYFMESYNKEAFEAAGFQYDFVQDNQSGSSKGVLRGLHFQRAHPQAKLVRVLKGQVFDVAVDLRQDSRTYGKWTGILLSGDLNRQILIPRGFAHGFMVISDFAEFIYKCDDFYHPEDEGGIAWDDPDIGIEWPEVGKIILSEKDKHHPTLKESGIFF